MQTSAKTLDAKTLDKMTLHERSDMMALVADALEATAEKAYEIGDDRFAENSISLANIITSCADDLVTGNLPAAELLLQQGIALVSLFQGEPEHSPYTKACDHGRRFRRPSKHRAASAPPSAPCPTRQQSNGISATHAPSRARSTAASAWISVVSKTGTGLSACEIRSMISVQPMMIASAPASTSRAMMAR